MTQPDPSSRYTLSGLSQKQTYVLADALELAMRLGLGQLEYLMEFVRCGGVSGRDGQPVSDQALVAGDALVAMLKTRLTGFDENASKSIGSDTVPTDAKVAFELYKAIRHRLAWDRTPEGGSGVHFQDPYLMTYSQEPKVALTHEGPRPSPLDQLPPGCFMGQRNGRWAVAQPSDGAWTIIADAVDAATAVANARAKLGLAIEA